MCVCVCWWLLNVSVRPLDLRLSRAQHNTKIGKRTRHWFLFISFPARLEEGKNLLIDLPRRNVSSLKVYHRTLFSFSSLFGLFAKADGALFPFFLWMFVGGGRSAKEVNENWKEKRKETFSDIRLRHKCGAPENKFNFFFSFGDKQTEARKQTEEMTLRSIALRRTEIESFAFNWPTVRRTCFIQFSPSLNQLSHLLFTISHSQQRFLMHFSSFAILTFCRRYRKAIHV